MKTQEIWSCYGEEIFFFILKRMKNESSAHDVFQNSFLKIHRGIDQIKEQKKVKAWTFQIVRNEIANFYNQESKYTAYLDTHEPEHPEKYEDVCCFERFLDKLPGIYQSPIKLVYVEGKKQHEVADILQISLANVKARLRRGKSILKKNFHECCKFEFDKNGKLTGEANCPKCEQ